MDTFIRPVSRKHDVFILDTFIRLVSRKHDVFILDTFIRPVSRKHNVFILDTFIRPVSRKHDVFILDTFIRPVSRKHDVFIHSFSIDHLSVCYINMMRASEGEQYKYMIIKHFLFAIQYVQKQQAENIPTCRKVLLPTHKITNQNSD